MVKEPTGPASVGPFFCLLERAKRQMVTGVPVKRQGAPRDHRPCAAAQPYASRNSPIATSAELTRTSFSIQNACVPLLEKTADKTGRGLLVSKDLCNINTSASSVPACVSISDDRKSCTVYTSSVHFKCPSWLNVMGRSERAKTERGLMQWIQHSK